MLNIFYNKTNEKKNSCFIAIFKKIVDTVIFQCSYFVIIKISIIPNHRFQGTRFDLILIINFQLLFIYY